MDLPYGLYFLEPELSEKQFKNKIERYDWCEEQMQKVITDFLKDNKIAASEEDNKFLEDLDEKVWINPQLPEHQEVEQFVLELINKALQRLKEKYINLDVKLIKSGSYYSNHRVGRPYEFDYLLEIPNDRLILDDQQENEHFTAEQRRNIFFKAGLSAHPNELPFAVKTIRTTDDSLLYSLHDLKTKLFKFLFDCINIVKEDYDGIKILKIESEGAERFNGHVPTALTFDLYYDNKCISVDLVPCFKYPNPMKNYKDYIPPVTKRLWKFLNRALCSVSQDGPPETNIEGINNYLYRDTLKSEIVCHISDSNNSCGKNLCRSDLHSQDTEPDIIPDNKLLSEVSPSMIRWDNNDGVANNCVELDLKSGGEGMESEMSKMLKPEEKSLETTPPMKTKEFYQNTKSAKTDKYDQAYSFFNDNLYIVIADKASGGHLGHTWSRLSTSLVENFIFSKLDDQLVRSLRIVKYFLQTFHIHDLEPYMERLERVDKMGVPSLFPSRLITVTFLNLVLESDLFRTKLNLTERVGYLLCSLVTEGYDSLAKKSYVGLFHYKNVNYRRRLVSKTSWSIFKQTNLRTLLAFFAVCMHRKPLDVLHLTSALNNRACSICFNQIYSIPFRTNPYWSPCKINEVDEDEFPYNYQDMYCFMHEYINSQRILCYERNNNYIDDLETNIFSRLKTNMYSQSSSETTSSTFSTCSSSTLKSKKFRQYLQHKNKSGKRDKFLYRKFKNLCSHFGIKSAGYQNLLE